MQSGESPVKHFLTPTSSSIFLSDAQLAKEGSRGWGRGLGKSLGGAFLGEDVEKPTCQTATHARALVRLAQASTRAPRRAHARVGSTCARRAV